MNRFRVTTLEGDSERGGGVDNHGADYDRNDPVQLNAYGLYTKRNSATCPPIHSHAHSEAPRKISTGFAQWTR